jgi:photosystem II stability/assembly factor-like uncharacterized protein
MTTNSHKDLLGIWGSSERDIYAVGYDGTIIHFDGSSWNIMNSGVRKDLLCIWGNSANNIYAVGVAGTILNFDGSAWNTMKNDRISNLYSIYGSADNNVFAVGSGGTILRYENSTWASMTNGNKTNLSGVLGNSKDFILAIGAEGAFLRYDGNTWNSMDTGSKSSLNGAWISPENDIFAVGYNGTIMHYSPGIWSKMESRTTSTLMGIWGTSSNDIFAVGSSGLILHYDGNIWNSMKSDTTSNLTSIWGTSSSDLFAVGEHGTILHFNGTTWVKMSESVDKTLVDKTFMGIWGSSATDVFVAGESGTIIHYNGKSWNTMNSETSSLLNGIWGASGRDVYIVGELGTILHYDGSTWSSMNKGTNNSLSMIWGSSPTNVFAVGDAGTIIHYNQNGVETPPSLPSPLSTPDASVSTTALPSKTAPLSLPDNSKGSSFSLEKSPDVGAKLAPSVQNQAPSNLESKTETLSVMEQSDIGAKNNPASDSLDHQDYADNDVTKTNGPKDNNTGIELVTIQAAQPSKTNNIIDQTATSQPITHKEAETFPSKMYISQSPTVEAENNIKDINPVRTGIENNESVPVISQSNQVSADDVQVVDARSNITTEISTSPKAVNVSLPSPKQNKVPIVSSILGNNAGNAHNVLENPMLPHNTETMKKDNGSLPNSNIDKRKEREKASSQAAYTLHNRFSHYITLFVLAGIWFISIFYLYRRCMSRRKRIDNLEKTIDPSKDKMVYISKFRRNIKIQDPEGEIAKLQTEEKKHIVVKVPEDFELK